MSDPDFNRVEKLATPSSVDSVEGLRAQTEEENIALQEVTALLKAQLNTETQLHSADNFSSIQTLESIITERNEGIAWLRSEVDVRDKKLVLLKTKLQKALEKIQTLRTKNDELRAKIASRGKRSPGFSRRVVGRVRKATYPFRHPLKWRRKKINHR